MTLVRGSLEEEMYICEQDRGPHPRSIPNNHR